MAAPASPSVKSLRGAVNEVMVQTGKALRAAQRNGNDSLDDLAKSLKARLPPSLNAFHAALDEIEIEVVRAKAVLRRDLAEVRLKMAPPTSPLTQDVAAANDALLVLEQAASVPTTASHASFSDIPIAAIGQTPSPAVDSGSPTAEPSQAEPSQAEPSPSEPNVASPDSTTPNSGERHSAEPNSVQPNSAESNMATTDQATASETKTRSNAGADYGDDVGVDAGATSGGHGDGADGYGEAIDGHREAVVPHKEAADNNGKAADDDRDVAEASRVSDTQQNGIGSPCDDADSHENAAADETDVPHAVGNDAGSRNDDVVRHSVSVDDHQGDAAGSPRNGVDGPAEGDGGHTECVDLGAAGGSQDSSPAGSDGPGCSPENTGAQPAAKGLEVKAGDGGDS